MEQACINITYYLNSKNCLLVKYCYHWNWSKPPLFTYCRLYIYTMYRNIAISSSPLITCISNVYLMYVNRLSALSENLVHVEEMNSRMKINQVDDHQTIWIFGFFMFMWLRLSFIDLNFKILSSIVVVKISGSNY